MIAKDILMPLKWDTLPGQTVEGDTAIEQALALLQAEIDKCLPEKYNIQPETDKDGRLYEGGYNTALYEIRQRLREFIGGGE